MHNHITDTTSAFGAGLAANRRIFTVPAGKYAGRMALLLQTAPAVAQLSWADYPYTEWSDPVNIVTDGADFPFDAVMDENGHIHLAWTRTGDHHLIYRRLLFSSGSWSVETTVTICDTYECFYPSLALETEPERLWVSWSRLEADQYAIRVKSSDDPGTAWGAGPDDPGDEIVAGVDPAFSKMIIMASYVYVVYSANGNLLACRRKHTGAAIWQDETEIAAGSALDHDFTAAVAGDNRLGVVFDDDRMRYREFDGLTWSGVADIDDNGGTSPQLIYLDNNPHVIYLAPGDPARVPLRLCRRSGQAFAAPENLDPRRTTLARVLGYHALTAEFADLTAAAADNTPGDLFHPQSSALLKDTGDMLYLGLDEKFDYLKILLSVPGTIGSLVWQYHNSAGWIGFTPHGGDCHLHQADRELLLWDDYHSLPADWQKTTIAGSRLFWIRAVVITPFDTGPTGTQITSLSNVESIIIMES